MLRKLLLVTVAVASLSAVSLAPTPASAWHGGWRGGWGWGAVDGVLVGVADGAQVGARHGGPAGVLVGDGVARVGVGADRAMSWRLDFTAEVVSFAVLSRARGVRAGSWSIVAGDRRAPYSRATDLTSAEPPAYGIGRRTSEAIAGISAIRSAQLMA